MSGPVTAEPAGPGGKAGEEPTAAAEDQEPELVSVVVPTRDSARTIATCLGSVRAQTWPAVELIVVDNGSADGTRAVAERLADLVIQAGPERSAQRNAGIARAAGAWVLWVDADMELAPEVVQRSLEAARRTSATAVFVPEVTVGPGYWTRCRALERRCYAGEPLIEAPRLVRTAYLRGVGGFDERVTGAEDAALRHRMLADGVDLAWADAGILHHEGRIGLRAVMRKRFYYGRTIPAYRRANPGAVSSQAGATLRAMWRHRGLLAADPLHAAGVLVLRACEVTAWLAGTAAGRRR
ncbi:MAG TPA: glycosyltransferase [Actinomycetota bacterium]|nr:glycosyltransferase [Actinomycetota bacterium]